MYLARYDGRSPGMVLVLGVSCCLIATLFVRPHAILLVANKNKRKASQNGVNRSINPECNVRQS